MTKYTLCDFTRPDGFAKDYTTGIAEKAIRKAAREAKVEYVDHTQWKRVCPDEKPGSMRFVWACIGVVIAITVVPMALGWALS